MARGFESKSAQDQQQEAEAKKHEKRKKRLEPEEIDRNKRREELMLTRTRVAREFAETKNERRRESLVAALAHLDGEIRKI
jgi:hypothetical protein